MDPRFRGDDKIDVLLSIIVMYQLQKQLLNAGVLADGLGDSKFYFGIFFISFIHFI
jgi:hypothetical protein